MRAFGVVCDEPDVEGILHLVNSLEPGLSAFHAEVFVERGAVLDLLDLQEEFVRMLVGPAAELAAIVGEHDLDPLAVFLEGWQHVVVEGVDGSDGQLGGIESRQA